jgi:ATP-dependent RNA helicase RhlE
MLRSPATVAVTPVATTVESVEQRVIYADRLAKPSLLSQVLKADAVERALVFTRTKHGADRVVRSLGQSGISAKAIHGNKSQNERERVLSAFRDGHVRTLVATDIAARGIDVTGITHVINYDLPNIPESYVHRIGRTARAGADGVAISFCDHEERAYLRDIEKLIRMAIPSTDRRTGQGSRQANDQQPAQPHAVAQHRDGKGGNGKNGRPHRAGKPKRRVRYGEQAGNGEHRQHGGRAHGAHTERAKEQPNAIENVTFMQRPGAPRRMAGHRAPR